MTDDIHIQVLPLDRIHFNPYQMWAIDPDKVAELAESIKVDGILQTPRARPHPDKPGHVQLVFGHHRRAAAAQAGLAEMAVDVRVTDDRTMARFAFVENFKRREPNAIDRARAMQKLMQPPLSLSQAEAGEWMGLRSPGGASNALKLLKLPAPVQQHVERGELPERLARQLVSITSLAPKPAEQLAAQVARADPAEREDVLAEGLSKLLWQHGRDLSQAEFEMTWPAQPIPVDDPRDGRPDELRACAGCPNLFSRDGDQSCTLPLCFDLKQQRFLDGALQAASERLKVPAAARGEKAAPLFGRHEYVREHDARKLLTRARSDESLGLRLIITEHSEHWQRQVLGAGRLGLASTDAAACRRVIDEADGKGASRSAPDKGKGAEKPITPAQAAKLKQQEDELKEERRAERAAMQRLEQDVVWLVQNFARLAAAQITISGPVLTYVVERLIRSNRQQASGFYGLLDWYDDLEEQAHAATGESADPIRRQMLAAAEVFEHALPFGGTKPGTWEAVVGELKALAQVRDDQPSVRRTIRHTANGAIGKPGFGLKLPGGWDKPPIHRTEYNCWYCGAFAGGAQRRLSLGDAARGWKLVQDGDAPTDVACPVCAPKMAAPKLSTDNSKTKTEAKARTRKSPPTVKAALRKTKNRKAGKGQR